MAKQTVAVTGGSGRLGAAVIEELHEHGYETANLSRGTVKSRVLTSEHDADHYVSTDLLDVGDVYQALGQVGADAVVHTATVYNPDYHVATETYESNVMTAYNLLRAATDHGVESVCLTSSLAVLGWAFGDIDRRIEYLPIDESHPVVPTESYGLGKHAMEGTADGFGRADGPPVTITSIRFPWIAYEHELEEVLVKSDRTLDAITESDAPFGADSVFSYIHIADAASAVRRAVEAEFEGHERVFAVAGDTTSETPTEELVSNCYPDASVRKAFDRHENLVSNETAERLLEWTPARSWRSI
jgi:nucleoside-diphosphate-sugar epimerase